MKPEQKRFLSAFVDQYLLLSMAERIEFSHEIDKIEFKERKTLMELTTSWKEEGRAEGRTEGRAEGRRESICDSLEVRFGSVSDSVRAKLQEVSDPQRLRELGRLAVTAESLIEFEEKLSD